MFELTKFIKKKNIVVHVVIGSNYIGCQHSDVKFTTMLLFIFQKNTKRRLFFCKNRISKLMTQPQLK